MAEELAMGWLESPNGRWHYTTESDSALRRAIGGWQTICGVGIDPLTWWVAVFGLRSAPPEGVRVCQRCERCAPMSMEAE